MALRSFYRSEALEHAAQREAIDGLATVTVPYDWLVLTTLAVACAFIVGWGALGKVERTVRAEAVVVVPDDRRAVVAPADGRVTEILVESGDRVNEGAPIARVEIPELSVRLSAARERERLIEAELPRAAPEAEMGRLLIDARAELAGLTAMIERSAVISSPYAGEVTEHRLSPGAFVTAGEEVARVRVGPPFAPVAVASLPRARASKVQPGAPARLHCGGSGDEGVLTTSVSELSPRPGAIRNHPAEASLDSGARRVQLALPDTAAVAEGDRCDLHIVVEALTPLQLLLVAGRPH